MTDQTDRQRAEAEARSFAPMKPPSEQWVSDVADMFMDFRSEGWEAAREEAAKVADRLSVGKTTDGLYTYDEPVGVTIRSLEYKEI